MVDDNLVPIVPARFQKPDIFWERGWLNEQLRHQGLSTFRNFRPDLNAERSPVIKSMVVCS